MLVAVKFRAGRYVGEEIVKVPTNGAGSPTRWARRDFIRRSDADAKKLGTKPCTVLSAKVLDDAERRRRCGLPEPPRYQVFVESCDYRDRDEIDVDSFVVTATSPSGAIARAKYVWRHKVGKLFPTQRLCGVFLATTDLTY